MFISGHGNAFHIPCNDKIPINSKTIDIFLFGCPKSIRYRWLIPYSQPLKHNAKHIYHFCIYTMKLQMSNFGWTILIYIYIYLYCSQYLFKKLTAILPHAHIPIFCTDGRALQQERQIKLLLHSTRSKSAHNVPISHECIPVIILMAYCIKSCYSIVNASLII